MLLCLMLKKRMIILRSPRTTGVGGDREDEEGDKQEEERFLGICSPYGLAINISCCSLLGPMPGVLTFVLPRFRLPPSAFFSFAHFICSILLNCVCFVLVSFLPC